MRFINNLKVGKIITRGASVDMCLGKNDLYRLDENGRQGVEIVALEGRIWVTRQNDPLDYVLTAGSRLKVSGPGSVLVEGLPAGKMRVARPAHS